MANSLWNSDAIISATGGSLRGETFVAESVSIDTRTLQSGALFVALSGEHFDGHDYLQQAADAGACAALVSRVPEHAPATLPLVISPDDTLTALEKLARAARTRTEATMLGITGSVGKTSAKEMLKLCLSAYGPTYASSGNYNNHIGLPLSLVNMPPDTAYGIFEMGMNHAGEIDHLTRMARPHVALITAVEAVHLEFFDSVEGIAHAKAEILTGLVEGGKAVLPRDNRYYDLLEDALHNALRKEQPSQHTADKPQHSLITFGTHSQSTLQLIESIPSPQGTEVTYRYRAEARHFTLGTLGGHWPKAALGVLSIIAALGLPLVKAETAMKHYTEPAGRGQLSTLPLNGGTLTLIDDAYNASPISMKAALQTLDSLTPEGKGRRIAVLGEMLELGPEAPRFHAELALPLQQAKVQMVILVGALMASLQEALIGTGIACHYYPDIHSLPSDWISRLQAQDILLIKGSHGSGVYQLVNQLQPIPEAKTHAL